jgi:RNA polymerase sigma-70 factor (ECF subfamily)
LCLIDETLLIFTPTVTQQSFEIFANAVRNRLYARALHITADNASADDMVQDTLLKLWTLRDELDKYASPEALASVIVNRLSLNYVRDSKRDHYTNIDSIKDAAVDDNEAEIAVSVDEILSRLPARQQQLLRMRHIDGLELDEMARLLQTSPGALRTALSRARHAAAAMFNVSPL